MSAPDIFYVEDDQDFAFIMQTAVQDVNTNLNVTIIENGKDALDELYKYSEEKVKPKLILLDLNLPGLSGIDLLKRIKDVPYLRYVPIVFFSTSDDPKDVKTSIEFGANAFVTKPDGYLNLVSCVNSIHDFWLTRHVSLN